MTPNDYGTLVAQLQVLKEVSEIYSGKTIDNIIQQIESRVKHAESEHGYQSTIVRLDGSQLFICKPYMIYVAEKENG